MGRIAQQLAEMQERAERLRFIKVKVSPKTWIVAERRGIEDEYQAATKPIPSSYIDHVLIQIRMVEVINYSEVTQKYILD